MWIAVGVFGGLVLSLVLSVVVAPLRIGILNITVPLLGLLAGGAFAGGRLGLGRRGVVGFAVAFALTLPFLFVVLISIQGMHGTEGFFRLAMYFCSAGAVAFALMCAIGMRISGLGGREVARSAAVFGGAGLLGGLLLTMCVLGMHADRVTNLILLLLGSALFVLLPASVGGTVLTRRLATRKRVRDMTNDQQ